MTAVSVEEIRKDLLRYLHRVEAGETILILQDSHPVAEMKPVSNGTPRKRPTGLAKGEFVVPDDFNDPLPDDIIDSFDGR